jgi:hypothetical protein
MDSPGIDRIQTAALPIVGPSLIVRVSAADAHGRALPWRCHVSGLVRSGQLR